MLFWIYARPLWQVEITIILLPILCGILFPHSRRRDIFLSALAALMIVSLTLFNRSSGAREIVLTPFMSFVWAQEQPELYREMLMNVLLFVPLGLFLPFVFKSRNVLKSVLTAFLLSTFIEIIQYIFGLGMAETDDLMTNTLGAFIGSMSYWVSKGLEGAAAEKITDIESPCFVGHRRSIRMKNEMLLFMKCLNDHLHNRETPAPENLDIAALVSAAKRQNLLGILYHQLKDSLPEKDDLFTAYMSTIFFYSNLRHQYELVSKALYGENVEVIPVKGLEIAQYYPVPALRTMGDIDLLIHDEDKPKIDTVMRSLGYDCVKNVASRDWGYRKGRFEFEFHPKLIYLDEEVESREFAAFFNDFSSYAKNGRLTDEFHFLFLFVHLRKHILNRGAGFRQFMDIAVMTDKCRDSMDWRWVREKLEELQMKRFSDVVFSCNNAWFEIEPPYAIEESSQTNMDSIAERIIENGVFGFHSPDGDIALLSYQVSAHGGKIGRFRSALRKFFPPYSLMRSIKQYEFVDNRPWLLPIAWVCRAWNSIGKVKKTDIITQTVSDERIENRIHFIDIMGLRKNK